MIDLDNGPLVLLCLVVFVFIMPFIYSYFIDKYDKDKPKLNTYG